VLLAESAFIAGDIPFALNMQELILKDARRRKSPLHIGWGLAGVAWNNIRMGNEAMIVPMLEEALQILDEIPNRASSINTNAQLGLAHLRLGEDEQAMRYADRVLKLAEGISPTVYALVMGFAAVAEVYFTLWNASLHTAGGLDPERLKSSAGKSLTLVRSFGNVFPIGKPYLAYYEGWYAALTGKSREAMKTWQKGLGSALKLNLPYEEGLIHIKLAHWYEDPGEKREHVARAVQIFEKMGAARELESALKMRQELNRIQQ
jgi:tetratricopeptide (TPR) repeat protein